MSRQLKEKSGRDKQSLYNVQGYSLVEILVVMFLFAFMALFAAPRFVKQMPTRRLKRAARTMKGHFTQARIQAMSQGLPVQLSFDESADEYTIWSDTNEDTIQDADEFKTYEVDPASKVNMTIYLGGDSSFRPDGSYRVPGATWNILYIELETTDTFTNNWIVVWPAGQVFHYD